MSGKPLFRRLLLGLSVTAVACLIWLGILAVKIYDYADLRQPQRADAAVVLGAAAWESRPSPVLKARIDHAIWLYRRGYVKKLVFTGGRSVEQAPSEAAVSRNYAVSVGALAGDTLIEDRSRITEENLRYVKPILNRAKIGSVLLVSDPLHMRRAVTMANDLGISATPAPTPTTRIRSFSAKAKFLARESVFYGLYLAKRPFD